jgi:hypothetical protein
MPSHNNFQEPQKSNTHTHTHTSTQIHTHTYTTQQNIISMQATFYTSKLNNNSSLTLEVYSHPVDIACRSMLSSGIPSSRVFVCVEARLCCCCCRFEQFIHLLGWHFDCRCVWDSMRCGGKTLAENSPILVDFPPCDDGTSTGSKGVARHKPVISSSAAADAQFLGPQSIFGLRHERECIS